MATPKGSQLAPWRPRKFEKAEDLRNKVASYFQLCMENNLAVNVAGLCYHLEIGKSTFQDYGTGKYDELSNDFSGTITMARLYIENDKLNNGLKGKYNSAICKFDLINNHGYSEKTESIITTIPMPEEVKIDFNTITAAEAEIAYKEALKDL